LAITFAGIVFDFLFYAKCSCDNVLVDFEGKNYGHLAQWMQENKKSENESGNLPHLGCKGRSYLL
jgi:hypothetical protein